jgi:hypothetical protein
MRSRSRVMTALMLALAAGLSTRAHHSINGQFDLSKSVTLRGTISKVDWINPHAYVFLEVKESSGRTVTWALSTIPLAMMRKGGRDENDAGWKPRRDGDDLRASRVEWPAARLDQTDYVRRRPLLRAVRGGSMISRVAASCLVAATIAVTAACGSRGVPPAASGSGPADFNGTWGHQRVFGIDSVCAETLPDGSVRHVECASSGQDSPDSGEAPFPKYKPELVAKVAELRDRQVHADTVLRCYPPGVPRIGPPAKIVQTEREVVFLYDDANGSFFRIIPLDGPKRGAAVSTSYLGESIGRLEGDTLVVEATNFTDETWLTDNGAFHSKDLRVVERLRRIGDTIEYRATAYDPAVLVEPWTLPSRILRRSTEEIEEPPRCEERDLAHMVDPSQFHDNPR